MGEAKHDGLAVPGRVVLAHEPAFRIGPLCVDPARRQVRLDDRQETLEPRVMQVLVALAHARGAIVTRDELIDCCWEGRIVGDDSINRVLSRIRRVAADIGRGGFTVETITKVGYRLITAGAKGAPSETGPATRGGPIDRRMLIGGAAALALGIFGTAAFWSRSEGQERPSTQARALFDQARVIGQEDNRQALAYLREAVRISPEYGEAWGALALSYRSAINNETPERVTGFEQRLLEAVRNAERYDPGNADAAAAVLPSKSAFGRWLELEPVYRTAIREHPDHVVGHALLGTLLMEVGRWSDAIPVLQAAKARQPSSPILRYKLAVSLWAAGRISAADDEIDRAMQLWPQHGAIWQTKIKLLALTGRARQALALASDPAARPLDERDAPFLKERLLFLTALATGSPEDLDRAGDSIVTRSQSSEFGRMTDAIELATLGRIPLSLDMLEGAYLGTGDWATETVGRDSLATHPLFQPHARPIWREARFDRILRAIGLEDYWRATGIVPDYRRH